MKTSSNKWSPYQKKHVADAMATTVISFLPALVMMVLIFWFSSCNGSESSKSSGLAVQILLSLLKKIPFAALSPTTQNTVAVMLELPIRKCAHMTEYAILAMTILFGFYNMFRTRQIPVIKRWKRLILYAWLATIVYAATDEFHQLFVPGRSGRILDVIIDSVGAAIALGIVSIIIKKRVKK